jgi:hypothetical protein
MRATTHFAEMCPAHESKYRALTVDWHEKVEATYTEYGIDFLGSCDDHTMHWLDGLRTGVEERVRSTIDEMEDRL